MVDSTFVCALIAERFLTKIDGGGGEMLTKSWIILFGLLDELELCCLQIEIRLGISGGSVRAVSTLASI